MKIHIKNWKLIDTILLFCAVFQGIGLLLNRMFLSDSLNYVLFLNSYFLLLMILFSLGFKGITKHFLAICFYSCFFIFLMGQKVFSENNDVFLTFVMTTLTTEEYLSFESIIYISLVLTYFSYVNMAVWKKEDAEQNLFISTYISKLKSIRWLWIATIPCALYMQLAIVITRSGGTYQEGYLINVDIPFFVKIGYFLYYGFSIIYLAFRPSKIEVICVLGMMVFIQGGMQLFQGRRALFATTILFVIWYLIKYYNIKKVARSQLLGSILATISTIVFFDYIESYRSGRELNFTSLFKVIEHFLISTGGSDSVIANTIVNHNNFPKIGFAYLLDPVINNPITNLFLGSKSLGQGYGFLASSNNFSHWLSYLTEENLYMLGYGMGSSYIAELYLAMGLLGVGIGSYALGVTIFYLDNSLSNKLFKNSLILLLVTSIFTLPRSSFFGWFGNFVYLCFAYFIISLFYKKNSRMKS